MTTLTRHQIAAILLKPLAVAVGLCSLPFIGEGLENVMLYGPQLWSLECFALASIPIAIACGLWQRRRWAWKIALWVSVPATLLAPILILFLAGISYALGVVACLVALLLGLIFGLIVYFLIRPETKTLFGIDQWPDRQGMIRNLKVAAIGIVVIGVGFVIWDYRNRIVQRNEDAQVVADIHELMEQQLTNLTPDDSIIFRYGAFKKWERGDWSRRSPEGQGSEWLSSRLETSGNAMFEKGSVAVKIRITDGPKAIYLPGGTYLKTHDADWSALWDQVQATHPEFHFD